MATSSRDAVLYLIHHVFLPPKLPQRDDHNATHERALLETTTRALKNVQSQLLVSKPSWAEQFGTLAKTIDNLSSSYNSNGYPNEAQIAKLLHDIASSASSAAVPLELKAQNAGLLITRDADGILFEAFELSPTNSASMSTNGRLIRSFPSSACRISLSSFLQAGLIDALAKTIAKMSFEVVPEFQPQSRKNGTHHEEIRDTPHPAMVTDYFMSVLTAVGQSAAGSDITKHTREEVLWHSAFRPWRRSPLWLLVRVVAQLLSTRHADDNETGTGLYKTVMVVVLSKILDLAVANHTAIESDIIFATLTKLSRRLRKLKLISESGYLVCVNLARTSLDRAHRTLDDKWRATMESTKTNIDFTALSTFHPVDDISIDLPQLDEFLGTIPARTANSSQSVFQDTSILPYFSSAVLPGEFHVPGDYGYFNLAAVEQWVEQHLSSWVGNHLDDKDSCENLSRLIQWYHQRALEFYSDKTDIPESMSIMYLTIAELWIACDKCACQQYSLLLRYNPEVDFNELQSLSLPSRRLLQRVSNVERYLEDRLRRAQHDAPSVFRDFGHRDSFAVRFFDQSSSLQDTFSQIEQQARHERNEKATELQNKKARHSELMTQYEDAECDYYDKYSRGRTKKVHSPSCSKCQLEKDARSLSIEVHEWPLSSDKSQAKATVFELQIEKPFSNWRDITAYLALEVLGWTQNSLRPKKNYTLYKHRGVSSFREIPTGQRVGLLSEIKPLSGSHYKVKTGVQFLSIEGILVDNALKYRYYDAHSQSFISQWQPSGKVTRKCTYKLPARSQSLQHYLRTSWSPIEVSPNSVVAKMSDCPQHMSVDEYKAFGVLPLGYRIQLLGILDQLAMPTVDFSKVETQCLMLQTIHCVGPRSEKSDLERLGHEIILDAQFCHSMLTQLERALSSTNKNWECWRAVATYVSLAQRILSLSPSQEVALRCFGFLGQARKISVEWVENLKQKSRTATSNESRAELEFRATEIALLCISTFNADEEHLKIMLASDVAISALLQSSILLQENRLSSGSEHEYLHRTMVQMWRKVLFRALPIFQANLHEFVFQNGLDQAVAASWIEFRSSQGWDFMKAPQGHWVYVMSNTLIVHFNLLTAELLVNGLPLTRLPRNYLSHDVYLSIFTNSSIDVMPTTEPGMSFSAKHDHFDHTLNFGMRGADLLLVATKAGKKAELIPSRVFEQLLPTHFVQDHFHWYCHSDRSVEFRPRDSPWKTSTAHWYLKWSGSGWQLERGQSVLINPDSKTGLYLTNAFASLELASRIHISFDHSTKITAIELPRLKLGFEFGSREASIRSRQYQRMVLDPDQRIRTLIGLSSKLVLKPERGLADRLLLIPEGVVSYTKESDHVRVSINPDTSTKTHAYQLDRLLGRIVDNGSLQSKLFLCYLHALTSHCLPDAATGHTGTEAALQILRSGAVSSFDQLAEENLQILGFIAGITPSRNYYPPNEKLMQKIEWIEQLSPLSQHPDFYVEVEKLIRESHKFKLFYPQKKFVEPKWLGTLEKNLLRRDAIRSSIFHNDEFGAEHYTQDFDQVYSPRDKVEDAHRSKRSLEVAKMILRNDQALKSSITAVSMRRSLQDDLFQGTVVNGAQDVLDSPVFTYHARLLDDPKSYLPDLWCRIHLSLSVWSQSFNKFSVMMWLSTLAFSQKVNMNAIQAMASFYKVRSTSTYQPPRTDLTHFKLSKGSNPSLEDIKSVVMNHCRPFQGSNEDSLPRNSGESYRQWQSRKEKKFDDSQDDAVLAFSRALHSQWPIEQPTTPDSPHAGTYIFTVNAMEKIRPIFKVWFENRRFFRYIANISEEIGKIPVVPVGISSFQPVRHCKPVSIPSESWFFNREKIFELAPPSSSSSSPLLQWPNAPAKLELPMESKVQIECDETIIDRLSQLCQRLDTFGKSHCEKEYVADLRDRCKSLAVREGRSSIREDRSPSMILHALETYVHDCEQYLEQCSSLLSKIVASFDEIASRNSTGPRTTPTFWLRQLNNDRYDTLTIQWQAIIVKYALAVTEVQRAHRLLRLAKHPQDLAEELSNKGHGNWDPARFPETLLLEAESGMMVRAAQWDITKQMRSDDGGKNSVMQLNMGEGKSSVIVPIVAAERADKSRLVRVIVAKPQSKQMHEMLVLKLGGLLGRRIYSMPFSRELRLDVNGAELIKSLYRECMANRGILLVQPEHILSFKLMGIECLISGQNAVGKSLLQTQSFFDTKSRDIVDESDENFSVKFELVYTMGEARLIDMSPVRWQIVHSVLTLVSRYALQVHEDLPESVEVDTRSGRVPRVRILKDDATDRLLDLVANHICSAGFEYLQVARQPPKEQGVIFRYIRSPELSQEDVKAVEQGPFWTENTKKPLLLLRGLIAGGILRFTLEAKRWRVNYGIDPNRSPGTKLAVPYRSKDSPSPRSEFSHPDVVIVLTSLTYYYGGLKDEDLFDTFAHLLKTDQAGNEYTDWVRSTTNLPEEFSLLSGVNIKDRHQCMTEVFPFLRYSKGAIDYFLSNLVFTKEMREFPDKLSASGWDLGAKKPNPTTGFSGTNDSRHVLPLDVHHLDLPQQKHTNALVLAYLLQDENDVELLPPRPSKETTDAEHLLNIVNAMESKTRVILDVGAQILELNNYQVAEAWLQLSDPLKTKAVVFFSDHEELLVLHRSGHIEPLQTSSFAKDLDGCLVYLDEAHTRGTNLVLPRSYRAAVTLGANLTKDKLVQACMRMRKLGKGQSVVFCVPEEIQVKIRDSVLQGHLTKITVADVLAWAITETWADIRRSMPLWATQGHRFEKHRNLLKNNMYSEEEACRFLEGEAQTIDQRYRPRVRPSDEQSMMDWDITNPNLSKLVKRCREFETMNFDSATLQEEQERELSPEIEEERQIQRPPAMEPEKHYVHPHLLHLIRTGQFPEHSEAWIPAFQTLKSTSAAIDFDLAQIPADLFVTADFVRTVKHTSKPSSASYLSDLYLRPVQCVLSVLVKGKSTRRLLILSPFEADSVLPDIRQSLYATLHRYLPRTNKGYNPLDGLQLFNIGSSFSPESIDRSAVVQLNLFAGQLYFQSYDEYVELCDYLGLAYTAIKPGYTNDPEMFVSPPIGKWGLKKSPVKFLREFVKIRQNRQGMEKTHLGKMLIGRALTRDDFE
ncbi:hypothetical protein BU23DRAFT_514913 [Bimuria novae-zelandiae CBS 107.79]|uniref:ubiquitinyl hydrolase 1 n=1 Tax=Bimuria novae-zelandiae CBS 107.79 TaxID=1447943 RepID=A0A6A5UVE5_9PLEO|nr:hypothetical protein BU23DRAFT_514913 [Bimuria novae-zelandiae CBS 107.79]